jgi:hypothetical protein
MAVGAVSAGTWIQKDPIQAFMQKAAADNATKQAEAKAAAPTAAPAADTATSSSAVPQDAAKITASAVVTAQSEPSSQEITKTYANGSVEGDNAGMATGMSKSARDNIESLNFGISIYNGAKKCLEDTAGIAHIRDVWGEEGAQLHIKCMQRAMQDGLDFMTEGLGAMQNSYNVTGTVLTQDSNGSFKPGQYTQAASGGGWSVSVKSTGEAKAVANGVDVSDQVSNSSSTGFDWRQVIAKQQAQPASVQDSSAQVSSAQTSSTQTGGTNNIDAGLSLLTQARASLDDFVARARKALAAYTPSQNAAPTGSPVQATDVSA